MRHCWAIWMLGVAGCGPTALPVTDPQVIEEPDCLQTADAYLDEDGDGFGGRAVSQCWTDGMVALGGDCDDSDAGVHPEAIELCDGVDRDCDGDPHHGASDAPIAFADLDLDGFAGTPFGTICELPEGFSRNRDDCDDNDASVFPGALERCDEVDQDCDGRLGFDAIVGHTHPTLDSAMRWTPSDATICMLAGEWEAELGLKGRRLSLIGEGAGRTRLVMGRKLADVQGGSLSLQDLSVSGRLEAASSTIRATGADLRLERVQFVGVRVALQNGYPALIRTSGGDVTLRDVSVIDVDAPGGLFATGGGELSIEGLSIEDVRIGVDGSFGRGLLRHGTGRVQLQDVHIENVEVRGKQSSLLTLDTASVNGLEVRDVQGAASLLTLYRGEVGGVLVEDVQLDEVRGGVLHLVDSRATDVIVRDSVFVGGEGALLLAEHGASMSRVRLERVETVDVGLISTGYRAPADDIVVRNLISLHGVYHGDPELPGGLLTAVTRMPTEEPVAGIRIENAVLLDLGIVGGGARLVMSDRAEVSIVNAHIGRAWLGDDADPTVGLSAATCTFDHSTVEGSVRSLASYAAPGGVVLRGVWTQVEPGFVDVEPAEVSAWDLRLAPSSALKDRGAPGILDLDGSRSDIGAYGGPDATW